MMRFIGFLLVSTVAFGFSSKPTPRAHVSPGGRHFFVIAPDADGGGTGRFFEVLPDAGARELWSTEGWYAFRVSIDLYGTSVVRIGGFGRGEEIGHEGIALQFYKEDRMLKSYSIRQLSGLAEVDFASVSPPESYRGEGWEADDQPPYWGLGDEFTIRLVDGSELVFTTAGEFKRSKKPNQALQPTRMLVTFCAYAQPAPSTRVADL